MDRIEITISSKTVNKLSDPEIDLKEKIGRLLQVWIDMDYEARDDIASFIGRSVEPQLSRTGAEDFVANIFMNFSKMKLTELRLLKIKVSNMLGVG